MKIKYWNFSYLDSSIIEISIISVSVFLLDLESSSDLGNFSEVLAESEIFDLSLSDFLSLKERELLLGDEKFLRSLRQLPPTLF